jgi:hypothetical protein
MNHLRMLSNLRAVLVRVAEDPRLPESSQGHLDLAEVRPQHRLGA